MTYILRKTKFSDIPYVVSMYQGAAIAMKQDGIDQWQNGYPNETSLKMDIELEESYVLCDEHDVLASAMVSTRIEETYNEIEGAWGNDEPYAVIHRIVVATTVQQRGLATILLQHIEAMLDVHTIRIDTHVENIKMRRYLEKNGFVERGVITLKDGLKRVAYDKININQ